MENKYLTSKCDVLISRSSGPTQVICECQAERKDSSEAPEIENLGTKRIVAWDAKLRRPESAKWMVEGAVEGALERRVIWVRKDRNRVRISVWSWRMSLMPRQSPPIQEMARVSLCRHESAHVSQRDPESSSLENGQLVAVSVLYLIACTRHEMRRSLLQSQPESKNRVTAEKSRESHHPLPRRLSPK